MTSSRGMVSNPPRILGLPWAQMGENSPAVQETWVRSLGREGPLEKGMAAHSKILAWEALRREEPDGLQSTRLQSQT